MDRRRRRQAIDAKDVPAADLAADLLVAGHQVARLLEQELARHADTAGLSAGEAMVLTRLRSAPLTMTGVMNTLHIKASTATSLVNRLERRGLVVRERHPDDARSLLVTLTDDGRKVCGRARNAFARVDTALARAGAATVTAHRTFVADLRSAGNGA